MASDALSGTFGSQWGRIDPPDSAPFSPTGAGVLPLAASRTSEKGLEAPETSEGCTSLVAVCPAPTPRRLELQLPHTSGTLRGLDFGEASRPAEAVFLHANGFCASAYHSMLAPLGAAHRVLAIDQRGHGRSTLPADPSGRGDWLDLRDDLLAVLDVLGATPVVLSGHSLGGTVALLAAVARPERVRSLVLFDPVLLPPEVVDVRHQWHPGDPWPDWPLVQGALRRRAIFESREAAETAFIGRGAFKTWPRTAVAEYCLDGLLERPGGGVRLACEPTWEASSYCAQGHDGWAALEAVRCPVTILRAAHGSTCDGAKAASVAASRPWLSLSVVSGTSHFIPQERPELARAALEAALGHQTG